MPAMEPKLRKVALSPGDGIMAGYFTEGYPIAEAIGKAIAFQVDGAEGERARHYGISTGVHDDILFIDNKQGGEEKVLSTTIYFVDAAPLRINWRSTDVALAQVSE